MYNPCQNIVEHFNGNYPAGVTDASVSYADPTARCVVCEELYKCNPHDSLEDAVCSSTCRLIRAEEQRDNAESELRRLRSAIEKSGQVHCSLCHRVASRSVRNPGVCVICAGVKL